MDIISVSIVKCGGFYFKTLQDAEQYNSRLHTKADLMKELEELNKSIDKALEKAVGVVK